MQVHPATLQQVHPATLPVVSQAAGYDDWTASTIVATGHLNGAAVRMDT
jgi:hypothetical protein